MEIKKYLFLCVAILTTIGLGASLFISLCIIEKTKEFKRNINDMEMFVLILFNPGEEKNSGKKFYIKYEDTLEIEKECKNVLGIIYECGPDDISYKTDIILERNRKKSRGSCRGVSAGYDKMRGLTIKEGRFFKKKEEESNLCVITYDLARELDAKTHDTIEYMGRKFEIVGILEETKPFDISGSDEETVYLPIGILRQLYKEQGQPFEFFTYIRYPNLLKNEKLAIQEIMGFLERRYGKDKDFYPSSEDVSLVALISMATLWGGMLLFIVLIFLLINKKSLSLFLSLSKEKIETSLLILMGGILGVMLGKEIAPYLMANPKITSFSMVLAFIISIILPLLMILREKKNEIKGY